jgi:hypothetical protein
MVFQRLVIVLLLYHNRLISQSIQDFQVNKPSFYEAQKFSVETVFYEKSVGIHKPWGYLSKSEIEILKTNFKDELNYDDIKNKKDIIIKKHLEFIKNGGIFIKILPEIEFIEKNNYEKFI